MKDEAERKSWQRAALVCWCSGWLCLLSVWASYHWQSAAATLGIGLVYSGHRAADQARKQDEP